MNEDDQKFNENPEDDLNNILHKGMSGANSFGWVDEGLTSEIENRQPRELQEKEVIVMGVYEHTDQGLPVASSSVTPERYFILLSDNIGRKVAIWIGKFEAYAISIALEGASFDRPMTHDLLKSFLDKLSAKVERILIDDLWQETYYAKISISTANGLIDIDARPSDAVALAVRAHAPIYMAESVLEQTAISEDI
ncbi:MAG: bifunctional nuclease family protein [Armatimonadota bacterium]